jgi:hypothetical protein
MMRRQVTHGGSIIASDSLLYPILLQPPIWDAVWVPDLVTQFASQYRVAPYFFTNSLSPTNNFPRIFFLNASIDLGHSLWAAVEPLGIGACIGKAPCQSKVEQLERLKRELGTTHVVALDRVKLIQFGRKRAARGVSPGTLSGDIGLWLGHSIRNPPKPWHGRH